MQILICAPLMEKAPEYFSKSQFEFILSQITQFGDCQRFFHPSLLSKFFDMSIKVCVFDDHKKVRDALGAIIKGTEGFEWGGSFPDCNNVLKDVEKADPDVVLMDIEMPGVSGIDAVKMLHQKFPHIKVIMQ